MRCEVMTEMEAKRGKERLNDTNRHFEEILCSCMLWRKLQARVRWHKKIQVIDATLSVKTKLSMSLMFLKLSSPIMLLLLETFPRKPLSP